jgi:hypothetical protein
MNRALRTPEGKREVRRAAGEKLDALHGTDTLPTIVSRTARGESFPRFPKRSTIEACWGRMRPVAHLWAAYALHRWGLMRRYTVPWLQVVSTDVGVRRLLATARTVQEFARTWRAPGSDVPADLLGPAPAPYLVPDGLMLRPVRPPNPPYWNESDGWLADALKSYTTRGTKRRQR